MRWVLVGKRESNRNRIRECILSKATELFSVHGYEATKLSEISKHCRIAEGTLFNYFKDKPTLFVETFSALANERVKKYNIRKPNSIKELLDSLCSILDLYLRIEDKGLESAFKTYYSLIKNRTNPEAESMSVPLLNADEEIYLNIHKLLSFTIFHNITREKIEEITVILIMGMFDEFIYSSCSFDDFICRVKDNLHILMSPYIKGFKSI
jgi:AcrR family transcriptional regulator